MLFVLLFIISFSFPHYYIFDIGSWFAPFFEQLAAWSAQHIFSLPPPYIIELISDSTGFYINAFNIAIISFLAGSIWSAFDNRKSYYPRLQYCFFVFVRYYLAMQMLAYGWSKIFKSQFSLPEPNLLFTSLGQFSHDILYWSTMGMSRSYVIFGGILEVFIAFLLFFRKTSLLAALIGIGVMSNVVAINFGFNISVKLYSSFLLLLFIILAAPDFNRLISFFIQNKTTPPSNLWFPIFKTDQQTRIYRILKTLVIGILLIDSLAIYIQNSNYNDDIAPRPLYHGAYDIQKTIVNTTDTLSYQNNWKRLFIHRRGYFITQDADDNMEDYTMKMINDSTYQIVRSGTTNSKLLTIQEQNNTIIFNIIANSDSLQIITAPIEMDNLPLMQSSFYWTIDEFR